VIRHKKFILLFFLIYLSFFPNFTSSQEYLDCQDQGVAKLFLEGIDACFRENYPLAEEKFKQIVSEAPQDPAGYLFLAMLYQAQMIDYESDFREKVFYDNIKITQQYANERIKHNDKDAWAYLFLGNAFGAKAVYDARKGDWWSGLNNGLRAKSALKEAVKHDPELYDAYVGLGSYHYWASVVIPPWAGWFPFIGDKREEGINEMELAQERSIFSQDVAANGLIWIYINEKKFDSAISLAQRMQNKYPEGKSFLWALAEAYYEKSDWTNALSSYREILERIESQIPAATSSCNHSKNTNSYYNWVECKFHIANCLFNLGKLEECILTCEEIRNHPLDEETEKRQKDKLRMTKKIYQEALKVLKKEAEK
jgi:tetratricopeptide (TPR) repeat protein